ncbi:tyrosine-protein phosphatase [Clostridium sp. J1101437_171009_A5]|uniref:tyrosine-protein phosphatase n=1 Tax=Clostridium sp. J1101437_171009_A5 TaxID=2787098 RepID=UPI001896E969|nr:tyrosine-protein phosphatase [Clostridium sp. J1101437_171009_A5]
MAMREAPDYDQIPSWALEGMSFCYYADILKGDSRGYLNPNGAAQRAELAQILMQFSSLTQTEAPEPMSGAVREIEKYGHAVLDISIADFEKAGFALGDTVDVVFDNGYTLSGIPYFNGYYVDKGEAMLRAYPGDTYLAVCINYGKLNETAGVQVGSTATISLAQKGAERDTQELNSLVYTDERSDYSSDAVFANFRAVTVGDIAEGALYRSASPVNNEHGRASYADALIQKAGVKTVLNLADHKEDIDGYLAAEDFASPYYKSLYEAGSVIPLGMPVDYSSESFGADLTAGLAKLSQQPGPYLVHCTEGKDRAGFTSALLECLMGASLDEVVADYMVSYENYYGVTQAGQPEKYQLIVKNNILDMLRTIAGVEKDADLSGVDLQAAAEDYLTGFGMTAEQLTALKTNLSTPASH